MVEWEEERKRQISRGLYRKEESGFYRFSLRYSRFVQAAPRKKVLVWNYIPLTAVWKSNMTENHAQNVPETLLTFGTY